MITVLSLYLYCTVFSSRCFIGEYICIVFYRLGLHVAVCATVMCLLYCPKGVNVTFICKKTT